MKFDRLTMILLLVLFWGTVQAQEPKNIAVLSFAGDKSITPEQLQLITSRFTGDLIATNRFSVLDRGKMEYILKEQGLQQQGICTSSDCQVQIGQLLGVDFLISGSIVSFKSEYAMHVELVSVATGQITKSVDLNQEGELQDVYRPLCKDAALEIANKDAQSIRTVPSDALPRVASAKMSTKRRIALGLFGASIISAGAGVYFNASAEDYAKDYDEADKKENKVGLKKADSNLNDASTKRSISYGISIGTAIVGLVLWFLPEGK